MRWYTKKNPEDKLDKWWWCTNISWDLRLLSCDDFPCSPPASKTEAILLLFFFSFFLFFNHLTGIMSRCWYTVSCSSLYITRTEIYVITASHLTKVSNAVWVYHYFSWLSFRIKITDSLWKDSVYLQIVLELNLNCLNKLQILLGRYSASAYFLHVSSDQTGPLTNDSKGIPFS